MSFPFVWRAFGLLLVLLGAGQRALAQTTPPPQRPNINLTDYDWHRGKNGRQANFQYYFGTDPEPRNAGFFGQHLRREIVNQGALTPEIKSALNSYRRRKWLFLGERLLFGASVVGYGASVVSNNYEYFEPHQRVILGVMVFSLVTNIMVTRNTNMHIQHAVQEYQGDRVPQRPVGRLFRRAMRPDFGGLTPLRGGLGLAVGWQL